MKKINVYLTCALLILCFNFNIAQSPGDFESKGLSGGTKIRVTIKPNSPPMSPTLFAVADNTGVYRSDDLGESWDLLHFQNLSSYTYSDIQITSSPEILYAIKNSNDNLVVVKSTDAGESWSPLASQQAQQYVVYLFADPHATDRLVIAGNETLYFSDDAGTTFHEVFSADNMHIAGVFWDDEEIYIATREGLLYSDDNGVNFDLLPVSIPFSDGFVSFAGSKENDVIKLYGITTDKSMIYTGIDGRAYFDTQELYTFEKNGTANLLTNGPITLEGNPFYVATALNNIHTVYIAGASAGLKPMVLKSTDGGLSFNSVFLTENNENIETYFTGDGNYIDWYWAEKALSLTVHPYNADIAILSDFGFPFLSTDGGALWTGLYGNPDDINPAGSIVNTSKTYHSNGLNPSAAWYIGFPDESYRYACYTDMHGADSHDAGNTFRSLNTGYNTTYYFLKIGDKWLTANSQVHDLYQSTTLKDDAIDWGTGAIRVSNNEGLTYDILETFAGPVIWMAADPAQPGRVYCSVVDNQSGGIYVCQDIHQFPNDIWSKLPDPPRTEGHPYTVEVLPDGGVVCTFSARRTGSGIFTTSSGVFYLPAGSSSWIDCSVADDMLYYCKDVVVDPHDPTGSTWYVCTWDGWGNIPGEPTFSGIFRTINRGQTWTKISNLFRVESVTVHPDNPDVMFVTTEQAGMFMTTNLQDASPEFSLVADYPFVHPMRVQFNPFDHNEIWVSSFGNGIRKGQSTVSIPEIAAADFNIFPNPGIEKVSLQWEIPGIESMTVAGMDGRIVFSADVRGLNSFDLDIDKTGAGVFFCQLYQGKKLISTKKLVLF